MFIDFKPLSQLASTMLGDEEDKKTGNPLNPLKKAMKRRNAKTVQFAAPSYVEPSDVEYSSDEEEGHGEYGAQEQDGIATQSIDQSNQVDEEVAHERTQARDVRQTGDHLAVQGLRSGGIDQGNAPDAARMSDETFDGGEYCALESYLIVPLSLLMQIMPLPPHRGKEQCATLIPFSMTTGWKLGKSILHQVFYGMTRLDLS